MPDMEVPARLYRAGAVTHARMPDADAETPDSRVELSFSSEAPVERFFGREILGHGEGEVDLSQIADGRAPLLIDHRASVENQVGVIESARVEQGRGLAVVRFGAGARAQEMLARVRDGEIAQVSVGYRVRAMRLDATSEEEGDTFRVTDWVPMEVSLVSIAADPSVGVGRGEETLRVRVEDGAGRPAPTQGRSGAATDVSNTEDPMADGDKGGRTASGKTTGPETGAGEGDTGQRADAPAPAKGPNVEEARRAERTRIAEIGKTGRQFGMEEAAIERAVEEGTTVESFRKQVLDAMAERDGPDTRAGGPVIGLTERESRSFSFAKLIAAQAQPDSKRMRERAAFELEVCNTAAEGHKGKQRGMIVPDDVLTRALNPDQLKERMSGHLATRASDQLVGTANIGGNLVDEVLLAGSYIDGLRAASVLPQLGVRTLAGLQGDVAIPKNTGDPSYFWVGEDEDVTASAANFGQVKMSPVTVGAMTQLSRLLINQSSIDAEAEVRRLLILAVSLGIDKTALQGDADADAPDGLADIAAAGGSAVNTVSFAGTGATPTWAEVVEMEGTVASDNALMGNLAYAVNPATAATLKTTKKDAGSGIFLMGEDGMMNGYRTVRSTQVSASNIWFGDWSQFVWGLWTGLDILVNPYSAQASGGVMVSVHQDTDFAVRHEEAFCLGS